MKANYYISAADDVKSDKPARKNDKSKNKLRNRNRDTRSSMKRKIGRRGRRSFTVNGTMATLINESGLYALVFRSKLPWAKKFQHWVTSEVLPSIRKHGMYAIDDLINNPELGVRAFTALMEERQKTKALEAKVAEKQEQITELTPKATYCDVVLMSDDLVSVTEIAKDYGKSAQWLNKLLHEYGIQFNQRGVWHLYQPYAEGGYAVTRKQILPGRDGETHVREHTYWTQDGRKFLYEFLKRKGILPITERVT